MSLESLEHVVFAGDTFTLDAVFKDYDQNPMDPDTHSIKLFRSRDDLMIGDEMTSPTQNGTGDYSQFITVPVDVEDEGAYHVRWVGAKAGQSKTREYHFKVVK